MAIFYLYILTYHQNKVNITGFLTNIADDKNSGSEMTDPLKI